MILLDKLAKSKTIRAGVLGWPVGHSLSPRVHGYWLKKYGIDGSYEPLAVKPEDLKRVVRSLADEGFAGANVTVPHKQAVLACMDEVEDQARRIGAVNTIIIGSDGLLLGRNTDGYGFLWNLKSNLTQGSSAWSSARGPAVVIGAGGASRAVCVALLDDGVTELRLINRTLSRGETLAADIGGPINVVPWEDRSDVLDGAALLVNTTTLGMSAKPPLDLDLSPLPTDAVVNDIVYSPLETPLLKCAAERGNSTVDGLGMLLHQARPGFAAWFGMEPEVTADLRAFVLKGLD